MSHASVPSLASHGRLALTEGELEGWGERLGRQLRAPIVITVSGELGAGKTTLVRAICRGYGVRDDVTSPTFAIVHEYEGGKTRVFHLDLYRLSSPAELTNVGWDEIVASDAVVIVEWPERAGDRVPADHLPIALEHLADAPDRRLLYAGGHVGARTFGGEG